MSKGKWKQYKSKTNQKRTEEISFRVTPREKKMLRERATKLNLSLADYILASTIFSNKKFVCVDTKTFKNAITKMVKADTNFNQATHALNFAMYKKEYSESDIRAMDKALDIISEEHEQRTKLLEKIQTILEEKEFR